MLAINHLSKKFGKFTALDDVSLDIEPGETFALLGPNGSGKTTLLRCLAGLIIPDKGQIRIHGRDVKPNSAEIRQFISYLPQRVRFEDCLTAQEVMKFYCRLRGIPLSRVDELFAESRFHFDGFADKPTGQYSGGMLQRLGLAVACLPDAPILILDEPTASLDSEGALEFRNFLTSLKQEGKTIIFSSHMLSDVEQLADRVGVLVGGKLVKLESAKEIFNGLGGTFRISVILENPSSKWADVARKAGADDVVLTGNSMSISAKPDQSYSVLEAIQQAGGVIARFSTQELSLDEIYLSFTRMKECSYA